METKRFVLPAPIREGSDVTSLGQPVIGLYQRTIPEPCC